MEKIKNNKTIFILIGIMILSSLWLITKGMPYGHDIEFHYGRVIALSDTIKDGNFLAFIHNFFYGYGYATGIFYSNFYFYIPALLSLCGLSYMTSFKIFYVIINILTTISIFTCLKRIIKDDKISIIGTILYMFSNYRLVDIYPRAAMGEILAFMVIPIAILGLYEIIYGNYKKWYLFTIGFVLLVLSHLITTFLLAVFVFIFILCNCKKLLEDKNRIKYLVISGIVGLLLGTFFLGPVIEQKLYGNINIFEGSSYFLPQDDIVNIKNFLLPTGFFNKFLGFSFILLLPLRYFIKKKDVKENNLIKFADIFFILGIIAWVFTTRVFPWKYVGNYIDFIQFPWRLLTVATTFLTFSYCIYIKLLKKDIVKKYAYGVIILISLFELSLYSVQYGLRNNNKIEFPENVIGTGEYLIYGTDVGKLEILDPTYKTNNPDMVVDYKKKGTTVNIKYKNNNMKNTYIELPLFNYLGYNSSSTKIVNGDNNLIRLPIKDKSGSITVSYKETTIQKVSLIISIITLTGLVTYIIIEKRKENGISK